MVVVGVVDCFVEFGGDCFLGALGCCVELGVHDVCGGLDGLVVCDTVGNVYDVFVLFVSGVGAEDIVDCGFD